MLTLNMFSGKRNFESRPPWARYSVAVGCVILGWLAREALVPEVGPTALPFIFFFPAAAVAAWYGGIRPGVLAVVLGAGAANWFFIEPVHSWYITKFGDLVALAAFLISCLFIVGAIESMHRANARALSALAERQRLETAARQTEERHTRLIHSAMDAILAVDTQQRITLFNPAAERMFGCPAGEAIGGSLDRFIPARHREAHRAHVEKFGQTGVTSRRMGALTPLTGLRANGEEFPIEASISQVEVAGQKTFKVILRDITERKQAEEALRAGAARLLATQLNAPIGVVETSLDHQYLSVNDEFCRLTGYRSEELLKRKISDITDPNDWPRNRELANRMMAGELPTYRFEKRFIRKDGTRVWVDVSRTLLRDADGKPRYVIGAMIDITERKQVEQALRESEERFRSLVSVITDVPWTTGADGGFVTPQPAWAAYTGQTWEELRGFGWANALHPDDRERVKKLWQTARDSCTVYKSDGRLWHAPSKQWRHFVAQGTPLLNPDGSVREWVGTCTDVEDEKQAEELMKSEAKRLELLVQQRTGKLQAAIGELEAFSYSVAHDVRAPLRAMSAYADLLLKEPSVSPQGRTYSERISRAAARLDRMTQEVLTYSRLARAEIQLQPIDLDKLTREVIEQYPQLAVPECKIDIQSPLLPVLGHEGFLVQILANLLINACKFVEPGTTPKILVRTEAVGRDVRLWVEDNGIGIAPEHGERLFKMFGRIHPDDKYQGTGIGLAVVKKAAERMGGTVGYESEVGQGSRFWVQLKKADERGLHV